MAVSGMPKERTNRRADFPGTIAAWNQLRYFVLNTIGASRWRKSPRRRLSIMRMTAPP